MSIQIYILSKLWSENNYPYKLKKELSEPIPFDKIGNLTESKLYYHFEALKKQGLIEPREVIKEEHRPDKQVFAITDKGREQLSVKIYELFEKKDKISELIIGLMFIRFVEISRVIEILDKKLARLYKKQDQLKDIYSQIPVEEEMRDMIDFANDYLTDTVSKDIQWMEKLIDKLKHSEK